jgi:hypothetical protein
VAFARKNLNLAGGEVLARILRGGAMRFLNMRSSVFSILASAVFVLPLAASPTQKATTLRVPNGGNAPQVAVDQKNVVHLIYFKAAKGDHGDIFYVRSPDGGATFSAPVRVNSQPNSAIAARPPRLAVGRGGRAHVVWNGSDTATPKGPKNPAQPADSPYNGMPLLYARLNDAGTAFEPQRNLMQKTFALDGGATVAADDAGNVYGVWHGLGPDQPAGEQGRRVWVTRSGDDGKTFAAETIAWDEPTGACGCCHAGAYTDEKGNLYVLYRGAETAIERDIYLLVSTDRGNSFKGSKVDPWRTSTCPMSSMAFGRTPSGVLAGWETEGRVRFGAVRLGEATVAGREEPAAESARKDRKYPKIATNAAGETIRIWTEGMGWKRGGAVSWQVYDAKGKPTGDKGREDGVPPDGDAAVFARADGTFVVVY